ncbi:MAG: glycosyltransferase family protein [Chloroflexota bacterium]
MTAQSWLAGWPQSILFVSGIGGDTQRYRCAHAQEQLALYGIASRLRLDADHTMLADALACDLAILHRVPWSDLIGDLVALLRAQGKAILFDTDDLLFDAGIVAQVRLLDVLSPAEAERYRQDVPRNRQTLLACDRVLVPTDDLARRVAALGQRVFVHRNALSAEHLRLCELAYQHRRARSTAQGELVIGYASGTPSHDRDFLAAADALLAVLAKYDHVRLHVFGFLSLDDRFAAWMPRIRRTPRLPWQQVPGVIAGFDINLAPLELDNPFCQAKSELKYFLAGAVGVPTVASRTDAFEYAIRQGENGFLAGNVEEWLAALEQLITDAETRRAVGERAREHVLEHYTPEVRARSLLSLLAEIQAERPVAVSGPELQGEVIQRQQKHLTQQRQDLEAMARQVQAQRDRLSRYEAQIADLERQLADLRRLWTRQLETAAAARRRRPVARVVACGAASIKKWLHLSPRTTIDGRLASPGPELIAGRSQGQTFFAVEDGLHRLEILFATFGRLNTGQVALHLRADTTATQDLLTLTVDAVQLKDNQYHHFEFEPLPHSAGRRYYFCLEAPAAVPGDAVSVWVFEDTGPDGWTRHVDGLPVAGQVVFLARYVDRAGMKG